MSQATNLKPMNIQLTDAARMRMQSFLANQPGAAGVRFGVRKTGCSGYAYMVEIAESAGADDRVIEQDGVRLVIDAKSAPFVDGTQIDFARQGLNSAFVFRNPNVTGECGCGESFTVAEPAPRAVG
jgi:iron-sulfur cluster assembly protein